MADTSPPRVFLSHASGDKSRFVLPFATRLRALGIDVWVDRWEMLPGDSLVSRIFEEGIENAEAVIVVLSNNTGNSRWVTEELNAAVVKRIETGSRLIPIVLDGLALADVPSAIRHLLLEFVPDTNALDDVVDRVMRSICGKIDRPAIGDPPSYRDAEAGFVEGLDRVDSLVLKAMGDEAVRDNGTHFMTAEFVTTTVATMVISEPYVIESLEVLNSDGLIRLARTMGTGIPSMSRFTITTHGLDRYFQTYVPEYSTIQQRVIARLTEWPGQQGSERSLSELVDAPRLIVDHVLTLLEQRDCVSLSQRTGGIDGRHFFNLSPKLKRLLGE